MSVQAPILTLTLNPALDMATDVPEMLAGHKLRCTEPMLDPGGGGLNVSRAILALGGDSLALVAIGGLTGDRLSGLIREAGVTFLSLPGPGETRQSLTVTEEKTGAQYRFMLPGPLWGEAERNRVFTLLRATSRPEGYSVISGSQPPGVPQDFPAQLADAMPGCRVVLDTSGKPLVEAVRNPIPGLEVLRMDAEEAESLTGHALPDQKATADFAQTLAQAGVAKKVVVARGAEGNILATAARRIFANAPKVRVKSAVGAGDSFVAGLVLALARGQSDDEALALAAAAAAAAVTTDATQLCRAADVMRLRPEVSVTEI